MPSAMAIHDTLHPSPMCHGSFQPLQRSQRNEFDVGRDDNNIFSSVLVAITCEARGRHAVSVRIVYRAAELPCFATGTHAENMQQGLDVESYGFLNVCREYVHRMKYAATSLCMYSSCV